MSRKLFAFLLSELCMVRVVCKKCDGVVELSVEKLAARFENPKCPLCKEDLAAGDQYNLFTELAKVIAAFKANNSRVDIEFTLPDTDPAVPKK